MKKFNVGIVGYGWVATAHVPAINATSLGRVAAICSSRKLDTAELSAKYGSSIRTFEKLDDMLADPGIDVISLCGFLDQHAAKATELVRAVKVAFEK